MVQRHYQHFAHARLRGKCRLDLADLHPHAADLDLKVAPSHEAQAAIRQFARQVAGLVQHIAHVGGKRIGDECSTVHPALADIAQAAVRRAHIQLADLSRVARLEIVLQQNGLCTRDRPADRHEVLGHRLARKDVAELDQRGFGRAVQVHQDDARAEMGDPLVRHGREQRFAGHQDVTERREARGMKLRLQQQPEHGRYAMHQRDARLFDPVGQCGACQHSFGRRDTQRAAAAPRAEQIAQIGVEGGRGQLRDAAMRTEAKSGHFPFDEVCQARAASQHRLWLAGRAGGEIQVDRIV